MDNSCKKKGSALMKNTSECDPCEEMTGTWLELPLLPGSPCSQAFLAQLERSVIYKESNLQQFFAKIHKVASRCPEV